MGLTTIVTVRLTPAELSALAYVMGAFGCKSRSHAIHQALHHEFMRVAMPDDLRQRLRLERVRSPNRRRRRGE